MKILLTGASGFIGKHLLPELLLNGHQLTVLSRRHLPHLPNSVTEILAETKDWPDAVKGKSYDLCLHLAWIATPGVYLESLDNHIHADATALLADTLFKNGLAHFIGLGTGIEYAPNQIGPSSEKSTAIAPQSLYARSKNQARIAIAESAKRHSAGYTWVRLFYPYGKGEDSKRIPSSFLNSILTQKSLLLKTPRSVKDWIEIRDVVSALIYFSEISPFQGEINLGTGVGTSMEEFVRVLANVAHREINIDTPQEIIDPYSYHVADTNKLFAAGWHPSIDLEEGLISLIKS